MTIQNYELSTEAIEALQSYRDNQADIRLKIRFIAILLLAKGTDIRDIATGIGKSPSTIERWFETYVSQGIMDSAPYFKVRAVRSRLDDHPKLICWFLPTYSPNLNLIERFWRLAKEHLVNSIYNKQYKTFRCNVFRFLNHVAELKESLKTLMTETFQILDKKCV